MRLTMPQLIMLNHAASVNHERSEARHEMKKKVEERKKKEEEKDPVVWHGKRLSEMNTTELAAYYGDFMN